MLRIMHSTVVHVLLWVLAAAPVAPVFAAGHSNPVYKGVDTPTDALWARLVSDSDQQHASIVAIVSSRKLIQARFRHVCGQLPGYIVRTIVLDLPDACWSLQGACHRVFRSSITGAGHRVGTDVLHTPEMHYIYETHTNRPNLQKLWCIELRSHTCKAGTTPVYCSFWHVQQLAADYTIGAIRW
jgi:hypothetical protein